MSSYPQELVVVVPTTHASMSTLLDNDERYHDAIGCITVKVPSGCTLMLDALPIPNQTVTHLYIEGPMPPPIIVADYADYGDQDRHVISATVVGPILPILISFPHLVTLDFQALSYDVDWAGLERASRIKHLRLWSYENVHRPLLLPPDCALDLHGFVTKYRKDADSTLGYLLHALSKCGKPLIWRIGYYDPLHVRLLESIESRRQCV